MYPTHEEEPTNFSKLLNKKLYTHPIREATKDSFIIYNLDMSLPTVCHTNLKHASDEYTRICNKHPGHKVLFLEVKIVKESEPKFSYTISITDTDLEKLPFDLVKQLSKPAQEKWSRMNSVNWPFNQEDYHE